MHLCHGVSVQLIPSNLILQWTVGFGEFENGID